MMPGRFSNQSFLEFPECSLQPGPPSFSIRLAAYIKKDAINLSCLASVQPAAWLTGFLQSGDIVPPSGLGLRHERRQAR